MSAQSTDKRVSPKNRVPAPLMHLIADMLATSLSYEMSDLLAVMQRLVFLVLAHQHNE